MVSPSHKSQRPEQIDIDLSINLPCSANRRNELFSSGSCGCRSACEPILNIDGTITTCSSRNGTVDNFRTNDDNSKRRNHNQTNTAFIIDEHNFEPVARNHGENFLCQILIYKP